jgi:hypothetical protein
VATEVFGGCEADLLGKGAAECEGVVLPCATTVVEPWECDGELDGDGVRKGVACMADKVHLLLDGARMPAS